MKALFPIALATLVPLSASTVTYSVAGMRTDTSYADIAFIEGRSSDTVTVTSYTTLSTTGSYWSMNIQGDYNKDGVSDINDGYVTATISLNGDYAIGGPAYADHVYLTAGQSVDVSFAFDYSNANAAAGTSFTNLESAYSIRAGNNSSANATLSIGGTPFTEELTGYSATDPHLVGGAFTTIFSDYNLADFEAANLTYTITNTSSTDDFYFRQTDFGFAQVPEPSSLAMFLLAGTTLTLRRRRR